MRKSLKSFSLIHWLAIIDSTIANPNAEWRDGEYFRLFSVRAEDCRLVIVKRKIKILFKITLNKNKLKLLFELLNVHDTQFNKLLLTMILQKKDWTTQKL